MTNSLKIASISIITLILISPLIIPNTQANGPDGYAIYESSQDCSFASYYGGVGNITNRIQEQYNFTSTTNGMNISWIKVGRVSWPGGAYKTGIFCYDSNSSWTWQGRIKEWRWEGIDILFNRNNSKIPSILTINNESRESLYGIYFFSQSSGAGKVYTRITELGDGYYTEMYIDPNLDKVEVLDKNLTIEGVSQIYTPIGTRNCVHAIYKGTYESWRWNQTYYWDQETGLLVKTYYNLVFGDSVWIDHKMNLIDTDLFQQELFSEDKIIEEGEEESLLNETIFEETEIEEVSINESEMIPQETKTPQIQFPSLDLMSIGIIAAICVAIAGSILYLRRPKKKEAKSKRSKPKSKQTGRFCIDCGTKIPGDSTFCKKCGKKQ